MRRAHASLQTAHSFSDRSEYEDRDEDLANLGTVHMCMGSTEKACEAFESAAAFAESHGLPDWRVGAHLCRLGMAHRSRTEPDADLEACASMLKGLERCGRLLPQDAELHSGVERAKAHMEEGRHGAAAALLEETYLRAKASLLSDEAPGSEAPPSEA